MYDNIGGKIKILAKVIFVFETIGAVVGGFVLIVTGMIGLGLATMLCTPIVALVSSWFLYGFGELVAKACEIADNTSEKNKEKKERVKDNTKKTTVVYDSKKVSTAQRVKKSDTTIYVDEGVAYNDVICPSCGQELSFPEGTSVTECPWCGVPIEIQ